MENTEIIDTSIASQSQKRKIDATKKQIRGSSLLLLGRFISIGLNFATQVMMVRYLSTTDYGSWGYALALVNFFEVFSTLGLKRSISRFIPIYHENEEYEKLFGTIALVFMTIVINGLLVISALYLSPELITKLISGGEQQPVALLLIMIFLVPVEAVDETMIGLFASFASPRAIFFRKYVLTPLLKMLVVGLLILLGESVFFLAYGYLAASIVGILIYSWVFIRVLRSEGVLQHFRLKAMKIPAKEIFAFTIPLLTSDMVNVLMHSTDTILIGFFNGTAEVARYRVILPAAHFNKMVMTSFAFLFTPLAARFFARKDYKGINTLYWQTAVWMGVLSFPVFALTFSMAKPLTVALYGSRYEASWILLQMLSFGYYFNCALGFNGLTLKVLGKVRYVVIINVAASVLNLAGNLLLIPKYGALGATIATAGSMIVHNILKQAGLKMASGMSIFDWHYLSFYLIISGATVCIYVIQLFTHNNIYLDLAIVAIFTIGVFRLSAKRLDVENTFPELLKIPVLKTLLKTKGK